MVDRSIFASQAEAYELFCFPRDFYGSGTYDKIPAWGLRDGRKICIGMTELKNSKGNPRSRFN